MVPRIWLADPSVTNVAPQPVVEKVRTAPAGREAAAASLKAELAKS